MCSMETGGSLTYSRVLVSAFNTIYQNLDLLTVGNALIRTRELSEALKKRIGSALQRDDKKLFFHAVLINMDMKSFAVFLEVLDALEDEKHKEILTVLSHDLQSLSLEAESEEVVTRIQSVTTKYLPQSEALSTTAKTRDDDPQESAEASASSVDYPVLYYQHSVEVGSFSKGQCNTFYSPVHDISVIMKSGAFPEHLDSLKLLVTVNDYSHPINYPDCYRDKFSVLLSLKSDPHVVSFREPVTVTIPHSAVGELSRLCVLVGAEKDDMLQEDPSIRIESRDERYLTFQTQHFSSHLLVERVNTSIQRVRKESKSKERSRTKQLPGSLVKTASLDDSLIHGPVLPPLPKLKLRSYSCPTGDEHHVNVRFLAALFMPQDTTSRATSTHWRFALIVIDHLPTASDVSICPLCIYISTYLYLNTENPW